MGGRLVAVDRRELLPDLLAAAVPVQVAPSAEVHEHIEDEAVAAAELLQELIMGAAPPQRDLDQVLFLLLGPFAHHVEELSEGIGGHTVQERRDQLVKRRVRHDQLHRLALFHCTQPQALSGGLLQVRIRLDRILAGFRMTGQRGSERLRGKCGLAVQLTP